MSKLLCFGSLSREGLGLGGDPHCSPAARRSQCSGNPLPGPSKAPPPGAGGVCAEVAGRKENQFLLRCQTVGLCVCSVRRAVPSERRRASPRSSSPADSVSAWPATGTPGGRSGPSRTSQISCRLSKTFTSAAPLRVTLHCSHRQPAVTSTPRPPEKTRSFRCEPCWGSSLPSGGWGSLLQCGCGSPVTPP